AKAKALPGVRLILTAADTADLGTFPVMFPLPGVQIWPPPYEVLASREVRQVGDAIAFVVADTVEQAKDAAEAIEVDWQPQPAIVRAVAARNPGATQVWPDKPGNLAFEKDVGDKEKTDKAFAQAAKVVTLTIVNQ